ILGDRIFSRSLPVTAWFSCGLTLMVRFIPRLCHHRYSCRDLASEGRSNWSPRDMKETELFEDGVRRDALDLGLSVMRECDRRIDFMLFEDSRDPALQVLPHVFALVQR